MIRQVLPLLLYSAEKPGHLTKGQESFLKEVAPHLSGHPGGRGMREGTA